MGLFDEYLQELKEIKESAEDVEDYLVKSRSEIKEILENIIREELIYQANSAMDSIKEYSNDTEGSDRLRKRLFRNLEKKEHVELSQDGEKIKRLFDPKIAGTHSDLIRGWRVYKPKKSSLESRAMFWKYGIYKPAVEGFKADKFLTYELKKTKSGKPRKKIQDYSVDYNEVINARLAAWGDKAPYWYFIEYGNAGNSRAYPSFPGAGFVSKTRKMVKHELPKFWKELYDMWEEPLVEAVLRPSRQRRYKKGKKPNIPKEEPAITERPKQQSTIEKLKNLADDTINSFKSLFGIFGRKG